jgi:hypothetical protein
VLRQLRATFWDKFGASAFAVLAAVTILVVWVGPLWVDVAEAKQLIPAQTLYVLRFVVLPLFWVVYFRGKVLATFAGGIELCGPTGRIVVCGVAGMVVIASVVFVVTQWPGTVRGVPTAETRGIVGPSSPTVILPIETAGIKPALRSNDSQLDASPASPTERLPQGPRVEVAQSIASSPVEPEPTVPVTAPETQSQAAPTNQLPQAPPPAPVNVRVLRVGSGSNDD